MLSMYIVCSFYRESITRTPSLEVRPLSDLDVCRNELTKGQFPVSLAELGLLLYSLKVSDREQTEDKTTWFTFPSDNCV